MTTSPAGRVLIVGSLNMDLVARVPHLPAAGETLACEGFGLVAGGKGANQAVAAARLGAPTHMVGCVGDDSHGRALVEALRREAVDVQGVRVLSDRPTGTALVTVDAASRNHIVLVPGANAAVGAPEAAAAMALMAEMAVVVSQLEVPVPAVLQVLRAARQAGKVTVLNPAPAQPRDAALLAEVDWLIPNEVEAASLSGVPVTDVASAREAAAVLLAVGCRQVVITLGGRGVFLADAAGMQHHPAPVVVPVDTTAAGDTFIGGFAAQLAAGASVAQAVRFAQAAAALSVTRAGAQASIPHETEVLALLRLG